MERKAKLLAYLRVHVNARTNEWNERGQTQAEVNKEGTFEEVLEELSVRLCCCPW